MKWNGIVNGFPAKHLTIDTEKETFLIDGKDFSKGCLNLTLRLKAGKFLLEINTKENNGINDLKELATPLQKWLASNYDPMCCIVVQADRVEVLRSEMSIPAEVVEIHEHWINMDDREAR